MKHLLLKLALTMLSLSALAQEADQFKTVLVAQSDAQPANLMAKIAFAQDPTTGTITKFRYIGFDPTEIRYYTPEQLKEKYQILAVNGSAAECANPKEKCIETTLLQLSKDFNPETGGHGSLKVLLNGATMNYIYLNLVVEVERNQVFFKWEADPKRNPGNLERFNKLFFKKNTLFGILVGVQQIIPTFYENCKDGENVDECINKTILR